MVTEVTPYVHIKRQSPIMGTIFVSVCAPNCVSEFSVKEAFYAHFQMVVGSCPKEDSLIVLGDYNTNTGSDMNGCKSLVGPNGSEARFEISVLLDFARNRRLWITGFWLQKQHLHSLTWYFSSSCQV